MAIKFGTIIINLAVNFIMSNVKYAFNLSLYIIALPGRFSVITCNCYVGLTTNNSSCNCVVSELRLLKNQLYWEDFKMSLPLNN